MSDARCPAKSADLPLKKRAMKKQFSPPCSRLRGENGVEGRRDEGEEVREQGDESEKRQMGVAVNNRLLRGEDGEAFDNIMQKQLEIVEGTEQFYRRMDDSLREGRVEPYFVKEQWDLYAWREKFFNDNFPPGRLVNHESNKYGLHCSQVGSHLGTLVPMGTKISFLVPIWSPFFFQSPHFLHFRPKNASKVSAATI